MWLLSECLSFIYQTVKKPKIPLTTILVPQSKKEIWSIFYGNGETEQNCKLAKIIKQNCKSISRNSNNQVHNFYICKDCWDNSDTDKRDMTRQKNFLHKWLYNPELSCCQETGIWLLVYVEGYGMFCAVCQMYDCAKPQSTAHNFWNSSLNVPYQPDFVKGHFLREDVYKETMDSLVVSKEKDKSKSHFVKENKYKEHK